MTRVASSTSVQHTAPKLNIKNELADLQKKLWSDATGGKLTKLAKPPAGFENATVNFGITPKGLMDFGGAASVVGGKLYLDTTNFAGKASWYAAPPADLKKLETLQKDMYAAAGKLPASKWSPKAPEGLSYMTRLPITPKGLLGVGTTALLARDGSVWVERRTVTPNAKPSYAKIG